jgi:signal transduction histidine kinase
MGLFVSRRFVELMGGEVRLASAPQEGTTVTVRLQPAPLGRPSAPAAREGRLG